uniref:alpha/beta hydrolase n=1 Tax=Pedobacter schmidteae TaxID=2201271 RepID=UPI000EAECFF5|nr:alpha/beta hydrolase [Pedobacter schmidteae]
MMIKSLLGTISLVLLYGAIQAQEPTGTWYGELAVQGKKLPLVFHINKNGDGYQSTMDSPTQGAKGIPIEKTTYASPLLIIEASNFAITYTGAFLPDSNKIKGTFKQGSQSFPLVLTTTAQSADLPMPKPRTQDPKNFPYKQEEITFINAKAGNKLAGTLTLPEGGKATKIAVLISGSGAQNRDEEVTVFNHRPFLVLSDWLTRNGIAVLRYDDRGVGQSTGNFSASTTADFADDAEAAVTYIQSRDDLKNLSIGLIGHSEGGLIAPMVASRNKSISFIVLEAAPGIPLDQLMIQQNKDVGKLAGLSAKALERATAINTKIYGAMKQYEHLPTATFNQKIDSMIRQDINAYPADERKGISVDEFVNNITKTLKSPWFRYFVSVDPAVYLSRTKCAVLALNGTLDAQVAYAENLAAIKRNLQKAGNKKFEVLAMEGLNHLFQKAKTGSPTEYGDIEETTNPAVLQKISDWIKAL